MAVLPTYSDGSMFKVLSQTNEEVPGPDGMMEEDWRVDFETPSGVKSFVRIPADLYTAAYVHKAIHHKALEIEKVHAGGDGHAA